MRNRQRPRYGFYLDHVVDAFGTFFLLGGMLLTAVARHTAYLYRAERLD